MPLLLFSNKLIMNLIESKVLIWCHIFCNMFALFTTSRHIFHNICSLFRNLPKYLYINVIFCLITLWVMEKTSIFNRKMWSFIYGVNEDEERRGPKLLSNFGDICSWFLREGIFFYFLTFRTSTCPKSKVFYVF